MTELEFAEARGRKNGRQVNVDKHHSHQPPAGGLEAIDQSLTGSPSRGGLRGAEVRRCTMNEDERKAWLAIRKEAGLKIDPETAEVTWCYAETLDPYGIDPVPEEYSCVGREYFARSPGSDVWVCFGDLPEATQSALWAKHKRKLAFPATALKNSGLGWWAVPQITADKPVSDR
jgi:hypothetical protein